MLSTSRGILQDCENFVDLRFLFSSTAQRLCGGWKFYKFSSAASAAEDNLAFLPSAASCWLQLDRAQGNLSFKIPQI